MEADSRSRTDPDSDEPPPHAAPWEDVLVSLGSAADGLSLDEATQRLELYGYNQLPTPPRPSVILRFLSHFNNVLIYVLLGAAGVTAVLGHAIDTGVILAVVVANAIIGFIQEGRAEQAMGAIRQLLTPHTAVLRDGKRCRIDSASVVPGDIILLEAGEKVPADLRLIDAQGLRIEEAILTGESVPTDKGVDPVASDAALGDRSCMAFSGTLIASGAGRGVAVSTGTATEIGKISGLLSRVEVLTTPLLRQMNTFARWLTLMILLIGAVVLAYGYFVGRMPFSELFMAVVGLIVAAIPEGLPAVLTITLAVGVQAMARRNAIVRRLPAIETLGSVSVICSDKTGTLTRNEMMASTVAAAQHIFSVEGNGYAPSGKIRLANTVIDPAEHELLTEIGLGFGLCNDAQLREHDHVWRVEGDPMEGALLSLAGKIDGTGWPSLADWTRTDSIPFDASRRYMAVLHHDHSGHGRIHVKGAPEKVLAMCTEQRGADGSTQPLDPDYWRDQVEAIAAQGQRVLALAVMAVAQDHLVLNTSDIGGEMVFLGLAGLIDPPRAEAIAAVAECHAAGIRVKMITGDHAGTARAIGRQVGLANPDKVLTGDELEVMDDAALAAAAIDTDIFARTSPQHKLRLVMALQSHGLTVAMTGDGVNDAPALKRADAGIAMGITGSEAAKESAELVLADDNFASIAAAVREGRTVYDNIRKVIGWTLPTNAGEAMTIILALMFGMVLPITAVQILWVNMVTAITLGIALAFEPTEENTMLRPPRPRSEPLLNNQLVWHIVFVSALFVAGVFGIYTYATGKGYPIDLARSMAMNTLVVLQIFYLFFIRNIYGTSLTWQAVRGTPIVWAMVLTVTLAQFAVTYLPFMQTIFGTQAVPLFEGVLIVAIGAVFFAIVEIEKQLRLTFRRNDAANDTGGRNALG